MPAETSQTLDRGLCVLEVLASTSGGLTVTELAARLEVNRTVAYRLVSTLEKHALVRKDSRGRLHVGLGILHLAGAVQPVLRDLAMPVLRTLAETVGCTAHLTVADAGEALALAVVEPSWTDFHVAYRVGSRHPLSQGAAGKAILLGRRPVAGGSAVAGVSGGSGGSGAGGSGAAGVAGASGGSGAAGGAGASGAISDGGDGAGGLPYAVTEGELQPGARGLAAPVRGVQGLEASVGIVTLGDLDTARLGPLVAAAADEVAARLS